MTCHVAAAVVGGGDGGGGECLCFRWLEGHSSLVWDRSGWTDSIIVKVRHLGPISNFGGLKPPLGVGCRCGVGQEIELHEKKYVTLSYVELVHGQIQNRYCNVLYLAALFGAT